jgi:hypothetical protein
LPTSFFQRLRQSLEVADPGWLRARQAFKTVLAVVLALLPVLGFDVRSRLLAALTAAFVMQSGEGDSRRQQ